MTTPTLLIVVSPYYRDISEQLVAGAQAITVPGALEIPAAISIAHESGRFDGFVALGCVLRGETTHYDTVCNESARGLMDIALREHAAIGNGILTCETEAQAIVRADVKQGNKGGEAAQAALRIIEIQQMFGSDHE